MAAGFVGLGGRATAPLALAEERAALAAASASSRARVLLRQGDVLEGDVSLEALRVLTPYGTLTVPAEEILRVEFAGEPSGRTGAPKRPDDTVVAKKFSIVGRAEIEALDVALPQGRLRVPRSDVARLVLGGGKMREPVDRILMMKTWSDPNEEFARTRDIIARRTKLRISEFTGTSASELKRALSKHRVLVLPELERASEDLSQVASQVSAALREFVRTGGTVISCGGSGNVRFLAASGLLACQGGSSDDRAGTVQKKHAIVRGVSGAVPSANATVPIQVSRRDRMQALVGGPSGGIIVGIAAVGEGAVIYCGWDYFQSAEPHQRILANAVEWAAKGQE
ncbi:MAG: hypothetical protein ACUVYA_18435 [Planctomycetota bacterium]